MPTIGIIIVSFNTRELLRACLASLRGCTLPCRVVVVDGASADGSAAMVRSAFPEVCLIEPGRNTGFAAGNNIGLREGLGVGSWELGDRDSDPAPIPHPPSPEYVLFLNPDTVVHPGAIEALVAFLETHPRVGAVGPRLLNHDGSIQSAAFRFPTLAMTLIDLF